MIVNLFLQGDRWHNCHGATIHSFNWEIQHHTAVSKVITIHCYSCSVWRRIMSVDIALKGIWLLRQTQIEAPTVWLFPRLNIKSIINMQFPGEHAHCGPPLDPQSGFTYSPQIFMENDSELLIHKLTTYRLQLGICDETLHVNTMEHWPSVFSCTRVEHE